MSGVRPTHLLLRRSDMGIRAVIAAEEVVPTMLVRHPAKMCRLRPLHHPCIGLHLHRGLIALMLRSNHILCATSAPIVRCLLRTRLDLPRHHPRPCTHHQVSRSNTDAKTLDQWMLNMKRNEGYISSNCSSSGNSCRRTSPFTTSITWPIVLLVPTRAGRMRKTKMRKWPKWMRLRIRVFQFRGELAGTFFLFFTLSPHKNDVVFTTPMSLDISYVGSALREYQKKSLYCPYSPP
jgi:hypothetical protein